MGAFGGSDRKIGLIAAVVTAACWSFLALFLKLGLQFADSYTIVWYRMAVSFFILLVWFLITKKSAQLKVLKSPVGTLMIAALCLAINYIGFMQGVHYTSPANAQVFIQLGPLLLAIAGLLVFKETLSPKQMLGFLLCLFGFALFFVDRLSFVDTNGNYFWGLSWIVVGAVTWAVFASLQKNPLKTWSISQINIYIYLVATVLYFPLVDWNQLAAASWSTHALFVFLGLNTLFAYGSLSIALKYLPATQVSPIITMNPLFTLILINIIDWMHWNFIPPDPISHFGYFGAVGAMFGIVLVVSQKRAVPTETSALKI
jgi:drug/metabolite transporter (DMT)-like permease